MKKMGKETKQIIDEALTKQLLRIPSIRDELMVYANCFMENFYRDTYRIFNQRTISELCSLSVKGGLGIENLKAQLRARAPDTLVWEGYYGDCDLNLIINKQYYPHGKPTGEVLAAVSQRIKILLVQTINQTRYATLTRDLRPDLLQPPLYRCNQIQTLARVIDFVSQNLQLPIPLVPLQGGMINVKTFIEILRDIIPGMVGIGGQNLEAVFGTLVKSKSNDFIVYDDRENNLMFISDLNGVMSSWLDVDYSFFPYSPGRMDSLAYEVTELAIEQQKKAGAISQPYDVFKITNTPFVYTKRDTTNQPVNDHMNEVYTPEEKYNLSMYSNNLIDDFVLARTALRFNGHAIRREDVSVTGNYTVDVSQGAGKCEFVDVAIPRIMSPEWFYCQDRHYYISVPDNPPPGRWSFKVCDWDYQVEENLNLLIEMGCGLSHSEHKAKKRIERLYETWMHCNYVRVFPRQDGGLLPPRVHAQFDAPASLVQNFTSDYLNLFGLSQLPDWLYNEVFEALYTLKQRVDQNPHHPTPQDVLTVLEAAKSLGQTGLMEIMCMADVVDGPEVIKLRSLLEDKAITVNWVLASYLLLKASTIKDVIWFPRYGIMQVLDPAKVTADFQVACSPGTVLNAGDYVAVLWDSGTPTVPFTCFVLPSADVVIPGAPNPPVFYDNNLVGIQQQLYGEIRARLMRANNQMLRICYGQMLNTLLRAANNPYVNSVLNG